jgi:hypothetical protein
MVAKRKVLLADWMKNVGEEITKQLATSKRKYAGARDNISVESAVLD